MLELQLTRKTERSCCLITSSVLFKRESGQQARTAEHRGELARDAYRRCPYRSVLFFDRQIQIACEVVLLERGIESKRGAGNLLLAIGGRLAIQ